MTTIMTEGSLLALKFPTKFLYKPEKFPSSRSPGILLVEGDVVMLLPIRPYQVDRVWVVRPSFLHDEKPIYYTHMVTRNDLRETMRVVYTSLYSMFTVIDENYVTPTTRQEVTNSENTKSWFHGVTASKGR